MIIGEACIKEKREKGKSRLGEDRGTSQVGSILKKKNEELANF